jgi:hypothetical protein
MNKLSINYDLFNIKWVVLYAFQARIMLEKE